MPHPLLASPDWYRALTLAERSALPDGPAEVDADRAWRRAERWRSQSPFSSREDLFRQRLAADGLDEESFLALLGETPESLRERAGEVPAWLVELTRAFAREEGAASPGLEWRSSGLVAAAEPLVLRARERLLAGLAELERTHGRLPVERTGTIRSFRQLLHSRLSSVLNRTLVLELHAAGLQGLLSGETPEQRYHSFLERMRQPEVALAFFQEYPVLARQVTGVVERWLVFCLDFLGHLMCDWESIRETFSPGRDPGLLAEAAGNLSDRHRGNRCVLLLRFDSGLRLVYKPKPLAIDLWFQQLLAWANEKGASPPFRQLSLLHRGDYGWVEFLEPTECADEAAVRRFYRRQGGFLALFYMLDATDFHHENLIACGEHPMPVDLEALFHPRLDGPAAGERLADDVIHDSVLRTGLLPQRLWADDQSAGVDLSGLGAISDSQQTSLPMLQVEGEGTDQMRFTRKPGEFLPGRNRPRLAGGEIDLLDYAEEVATGFERVVRLLLAHRDELLSPSGPLAASAEAEVRVIVRPTRVYAQVLQESFHPFVLRDALDRDRLRDRLWVAVEDQPSLAPLIAAELEDLERADIPLFTTRPGSRDLWSSGGRRFPGMLAEPGLERVSRRLRGLSEEDLALQLRIVRGAFTALTMTNQRRWPAYRFAESASEATAGRLLRAARGVGDRLEALAFRHHGSASWFGFSLVGESAVWAYEPLGYDLYGGLPGIALFLAHLAAATGEERYDRLAREALATVRGRMALAPGVLRSIGAYAGLGGLAYTFLRLGSLWRDEEVLAAAYDLVDPLPELIDQDRQLDVIGGAAGCLLALLRLHQVRPGERTLAAARRCGELLLDHAQTMEQGLGWALERAPRPLLGLSHGAAGIGWALLELATATSDERFREAGRGAIAYERSLFSAADGNWPDLRDKAGESHGLAASFTCAWCHGGPGIGLARLASMPHLDDRALRGEIEIAIATTLAQGFGKNHSLCHGDLGNLDLLLEAGRSLGEPALSARAYRLAGGVLDSIAARGWLCGSPLGGESPGLLTGLAGIGYQLLRLADPERVPSILILGLPPLQAETPSASPV